MLSWQRPPCLFIGHQQQGPMLLGFFFFPCGPPWAKILTSGPQPPFPGVWARAAGMAPRYSAWRGRHGLGYVSRSGPAEHLLPPSQAGGSSPRWSVLRLHHLRRPAPGKLRANASITSKSSILPYHHQLPSQPNVPHRSDATSRTPQNSSTENPSQCLVRCSVCNCPAALPDG